MTKAKSRQCECGNNCFKMLPTKISTPLEKHVRFPILLEEFVNIVDRPCVTLYALSEGSHQKAIWKCSRCSNVFKLPIDSRTTKNQDCRNCIPEEESLAFRRPDIAQDFIENLTAPEKLPYKLRMYSTDRIRLSCSKCAFEWESTVVQQVQQKTIRCEQCRPLKISKEKVIKAPAKPKVRKRLECECGNNCANYPIMQPPKEGNSLADGFPELIKEWHPTLNGCLTPKKLGKMSGKSVHWKCKTCNHEWYAAVANRTSPHLNAGCPPCGRNRANDAMRGVIKTPKKGRSLTERYPNIAQYWHPTKNGELTPDKIGAGSETSVYWLCALEHESYTRPSAKISKSRGETFPCTECGHIERATPKRGESFADLHPEVAALWHPTKNGDLSPYDFKPHAQDAAWFLCPQGHDTEALITSRATGFTCGQCAIGRKSKIEGVFREAIRASGILVDMSDDNGKVALAGWSRKTAEIDILGVCALSGVPVAIEYDGEYYHGTINGGKWDADVRKTQLLLDAGYVVIRIREHDLALLDFSDPRFFQFNHDYSPRPQMRVPENVASSVAIIASFLKSLSPVIV